MTEITSPDELRALIGSPMTAAARKTRTRLDEVDRQWLSRSPLCLVATAAGDGTCDVSPKGDPPGFARVLDDATVALPERPGNRRADGFHNILSNPRVGLIFLVPGRGDTLRINGTARLLRDGPFFDEMVVSGHRPLLALVVAVEEVFFHCSKAFMRSGLWDPATWGDPADLPSRAQITRRFERSDESLASLEEYYGPTYADRLYRDG